MLAEHEKSDISQVATSHLIRLIVIITAFPFVVNNFVTETVFDDEIYQICKQLFDSKITGVIYLVLPKYFSCLSNLFSIKISQDVFINF